MKLTQSAIFTILICCGTMALEATPVSSYFDRPTDSENRWGCDMKREPSCMGRGQIVISDLTVKKPFAVPTKSVGIRPALVRKESFFSGLDSVHGAGHKIDYGSESDNEEADSESESGYDSSDSSDSIDSAVDFAPRVRKFGPTGFYRLPSMSHSTENLQSRTENLQSRRFPALYYGKRSSGRSSVVDSDSSDDYDFGSIFAKSDAAARGYFDEYEFETNITPYEPDVTNYTGSVPEIVVTDTDLDSETLTAAENASKDKRAMQSKADDRYVTTADGVVRRGRFLNNAVDFSNKLRYKPQVEDHSRLRAI